MKRLWIAALSLLALCATAVAQVNVKPCTDVANSAAGTRDCLPVTSSNPLQVTGPVTATPATPGVGSGTAGYPAGATPVANAATGTTAAVTATLPATAGQFTYLCNFQVSAAGGTATISPITVAGVQGGSLVFQGISAGGAPFTPPSWAPNCLRSSAVNTAITITTTADGTATAVNVQASGYTQ